MGTVSTVESAAAGTMLAAALSYADAGHPVLPLHTPTPGGCSCGRQCGSPGKHPYGRYGLSRATTDLEQIGAWWDRRPDANTAIRCDGLVVLDIDGDDGHRSITRLEADLGPLPETWEQTTGRGKHLIYMADIDGNSTRGLGNPPGLDLRGGRRGYIVCAPSLHSSGRRYESSRTSQPAALPPEWRNRLRKPPTDRTETQQDIKATMSHATTAYGRAALEGELQRLVSAAVGTRNDTLNLISFRLAQLVGGGELSLDDLHAAVFGYALRSGLEPLEIKLTMQHAISAGIRSPRGRKW